MNCTVSIVIPCYNHGQYLNEAIQSIRDIDTPIPYEILIMDDGSTQPGTINELTRLEATGYTVFRQNNQGLASARNNLINKAKGKYILPLDADNKLHPNYLTKAIDILEKNSSIGVVYGNPVFFGDEEGVKEMQDFEIDKILFYNYIDACAVYRKDVWQKVGGYDGSMPAMGNEDWEFWLSIYFSGAIIFHLNEPCFYYRSRHDSMSVTTTRPGFEANKKYIYSKYGEKLVNLYLEKKAALEYVNNNRTKAIIKLILGHKL